MFARWYMPRTGESLRSARWPYRPTAKRRWALPTMALTMVLALAGCRLPAAQGPVSRSLAESRQLSQQGVSALDAGDTATADRLFSEAVETCDSDPNARRHYAETLWQRGKRADAIVQLNEAIRLSPEDDTLLVRAAEIHLAMGDAAAAQKDVRLAIDINPRSPTAWMLVGRIEAVGGHPRDALAAYHRALSYAPENRDALFELAECYRRLGQPERALLSLQNLADTYPPGEEPRQVAYLQGLALAALGRDQDAVEALAQAVSRGTPNAELLYALAEAETRCGLPEQAWRHVQQAIAADPRHAPSRRLAEHLARAQQPDRPLLR